MSAIKIYENKNGDRFVKMQINMIVDIPIDEDIYILTKRDCIGALFEMERQDLGEMILNESINANFITEFDNVIHIEADVIIPNRIVEIPKETEYLSFELFHDTVKSEMLKGNSFAEIFSRNEFTVHDLEKIKEIGFDFYRENDKYVFTWDNLNK